MPVAGAIGAVAGGALQAQGSTNAANAQQQASQDAIRAQLAMFNQSRADTLPYQTTGVGALNALAQLYGLPTYVGGTDTGGIQITGGETKQKKRNFFDKVTDPLNIAKGFGGTSYDPLALFSKGTTTSPIQFTTGGGAGGTGSGGAVAPGTGMADFSAFYQTPDFLVARDEGIKALDRSAAARGGLYSGGADADRMRFASNLGTQAFGNFTNNLFRLAGIGGSANSQLNALGQGAGSAIASGLSDAGAARAMGIAGQTNAWGNALGQLGGSLGQAWGNRGFSPQGSGSVYSFGNNPQWYAGIGGAGGSGG